MGGLGGLFLIDELRTGATGVMTGFALPEALVAVIDAFSADPQAAVDHECHEEDEHAGEQPR